MHLTGGTTLLPPKCTKTQLNFHSQQPKNMK